MPRGEESDSKLWGPWARSGDLCCSALLGAFGACWTGCLQPLLLGVPGNTRLWSSVGERWDAAGEQRSVTLAAL